MFLQVVERKNNFAFIVLMWSLHALQTHMHIFFPKFNDSLISFQLEMSDHGFCQVTKTIPYNKYYIWMQEVTFNFLGGFR